MPFLARPAYRLLAAAAVDLLPRWARELLGLGDRSAVARAGVRLGARAVLAGMGWVSAASRPAGPTPAPG